MTVALWFVAAYLLGAIPTSFLVGKALKGIDLRQVGSKNLGATNLYRVMGLKVAIPVALFDIAKGFIPVVVFAPQISESPLLALALGATAILGHVFSVFVGFRGGKGVATAAGVMLGLVPAAIGVCLVAWIVIVWITRYVSLGSIVGALVLPPAAWLLHPSKRPLLPFVIVVALTIVWLHRANIGRLRAGTESRVGRRATPGAPA